MVRRDSLTGTIGAATNCVLHSLEGLEYHHDSKQVEENVIAWPRSYNKQQLLAVSAAACWPAGLRLGGWHLQLL